MPAVTDQGKRLARIQRLSDELHAKCTTNTDKTRHRCLDIALELVELLKAEDNYQNGRPLSVHGHALLVRAGAATRTAKALVEARTLRRMYRSGQPAHRAKP
jgi:hypothetical protein